MQSLSFSDGRIDPIYKWGTKICLIFITGLFAYSMDEDKMKDYQRSRQRVYGTFENCHEYIGDRSGSYGIQIQSGGRS